MGATMIDHFISMEIAEMN